MTRIAVGGFLHETNTFAPTKATFDDFVHGGGWPALAHGAEVLRTMRNINVGLAGFVAQASQWLEDGADHLVRRQPVRTCNQGCVRALSSRSWSTASGRAGPLDAVYLDLHGAMVTEHLDDGEGEVLARVRSAIGKRSALRCES